LSRDADVVSTLNEISFVYQDKGQYDKALDYLEQALRLAKQLEWDAGVAKCLKGLGLIYAQLGQYDKAFEYSEQALELNRKLGIDIEVVGDITNIASVYFSWGKWDKALEYSEQALELAHKLKRDDILATTLNNMGMFYATWKQYDKALNYFEQALELDRKLNREPGIATDLNNIATIYGDWGQYDKALEYFEQVLESFRKVGKDAGSAVLLGNIGTVYREWKQYDKALEYYKQELEIYRKLRRETEIAKTLYDIGGLYFEYLKQYPEAIPYLIEAIELIEKLRKTAPKDIRRDFLAGWITPYYVLTLCYIYTGDFANAFQTYELSRARWLAEQLAGYDADIEIPSIQHIQSELAEDTAILVYVASMAVFVITKEDYTIVELPKDEFVQEMMTDYRQEIENALKNVKNPTQTVFPRKEGEEFMTLEIENTDFNKIIQYYRLVGNPKAGRGSVIRFDNQEQRENVQQVLSKRLYRFFLGHIQDHITGKTKLLIVPDGLLNFLPFETLLDVQGKYAVETYQISYTPSLTVLETIQQRQYDPSRKPLLAFGGAVYNPQTYQGDTIENQAQLASLQRQADWLLSQGSPLEELYGKLGYTTWNNLPGTLHEVTMLQQIVNGADIVTGEQVTESTVKELSDKGNLADYTVLHFATHGIAVPELPELSALVLSRKDNSEDGYLRVEEIAELDIQADFVNLSACETGLGRINSGEGVLGLTQAFLVAGAKGLSVSLWQVADESTAEFMVALYKLVEEQGLSYAEAMTEVKRRFIKGEFGKKWTAPFYWAPFVYYGKN
jgi:CHAT domain-containing protein/Tfp pilus assembly protein PilF